MQDWFKKEGIKMDVTGNGLFNTADILVIIGNLIFWIVFYKKVVKKTINYKKELAGSRVVYVTGNEVLKEIDKFQKEILDQ